MKVMRKFYRSCVRIIAGVSRSKQWLKRIKQSKLNRIVGVQSLEHCLGAKLFRWLGHVARMSRERLPRKFLFSWVDHSRPRGRPTMKWVHRVSNLLKKAIDDVHSWKMSDASEIQEEAKDQVLEAFNIPKNRAPDKKIGINQRTWFEAAQDRW